MDTKIYFNFEKETKGALRYQEVKEDGEILSINQGATNYIGSQATVGTLYIRKNMINGIPKKLEITIKSIK